MATNLDKTKYAVCRLTKPFAWLSMDRYFQVVWGHHLQSNRYYLDKGSSGVSISTKHLKVLEWCDSQEEAINRALFYLKERVIADKMNFYPADMLEHNHLLLAKKKLAEMNNS